MPLSGINMKIIRFDSLKFIPASHDDPLSPGALKKILLSRGDIPNGRVQMINWAKMGVGKSFQPHYHEDMAEVFIILTGKAQIQINKEIEDLYKGDVVIIPEKQTHLMKNIAETELEYIALGITTGDGTGKTVNV